MRITTLKQALLPLAALAAAPAFAATNLVQNGNFEQSSGTGELAQNIATTAAWSVGATTDGSTDPFVFIVDNTADAGNHTASGGFRSVFFPSAQENIHIWGPANADNGGTTPGVANGFTGSHDGGFFFGADAAYANAPISQSVGGLTIGKQYTLSFEYASAQFTDANGANYSGWDVGLDGMQVASVSNNNADKGFVGWQTKTITFTATSASTVLSFLATGGPSGLPPFALLDGVSITEVPLAPSVPEPASVAMLLAGLGIVGQAARRRHRAG